MTFGNEFWNDVICLLILSVLARSRRRDHTRYIYSQRQLVSRVYHRTVALPEKIVRKIVFELSLSLSLSSVTALSKSRSEYFFEAELFSHFELSSSCERSPLYLSKLVSPGRVLKTPSLLNDPRNSDQ